MDTGLKGIHVYITGASGGIGLETAKQFLEEGCKVSLHYNTNKDPLKKLVDQFPEITFKTNANVLNEAEVINSVKEAKRKFGTIHCMVINHGIWISEEVPIWKMDLNQWNKTIAIDQTGSFLFAREYLRQLRGINKTQENLSLIFVGSTAGKFGEANHVDYSAAKSALMYGMTLSLKNEIIRIHPKGRVNSVMPGWVLTPMAEEALDDPEAFERILKTIALRKVARPSDVASSIVFLAAEKLSGHISGSILEIAGGMEGRILH